MLLNRKPVPSDLTNRLRIEPDRWMSRRGAGHIVISVEDVRRDEIWTEALGDADASGRRMQTDTPYFIASIDKLFMAIIVMKLREQGIVELSAPIREYLPAGLIAGLHRMKGRDFTNEITVRHILSHTSGIPDWLEDRPRNGGSIVDEVVENGDRAFRVEEMVRRVAEHHEPHFPPVQQDDPRPRIRYSDTNYVLVRAIIESVTGRAIERVYREILINPLGLSRTFIAGEAGGAVDAAGLWAGRDILDLPLLMQSIAGIYSTTSETIAIMRALVEGRLVGDESFHLMQQRWLRFGLPLDRSALRAPGWPIEYGLGLKRFKLPRIFTPTWTMPAVIGHTGSTGSWLFYCPDLGVYTAGSVSEISSGAAPYRMVPRILRLLRARHLQDS